MKKVDLSGRVYGKLLVIKRLERIKYKWFWLCKCECGNEKSIWHGDLTKGSTTSCGCYRRVGILNHAFKHGKSTSSIWVRWRHMMSRCYNPKSEYYFNYGGRGIKVCDRWHNSTNFITDMGDPPIGSTLERIDNNLGYFPENCKWANYKTQARNKRNNRIIIFNGIKKCLSQWAEEYGVNRSLISARLKRNWSIKDAISTPAIKKYIKKCK